jgi:hypothetical protein
MRTDTAYFRNKLKRALRISREKWNKNPKEETWWNEACGFCEEFECSKCMEIFWEKLGLIDNPIKAGCVYGVPEVYSEDRIVWKRACTIMHKRFDKIAKLYGVDA